MSNIYITEYAELAKDASGFTIPAGREPAIATQKIPFTSTEGQSEAFNKATKFVRIYCDAAAYLKFGANPQARTAEDMPVSATTAEFFGVIGGQKVSAVS